MSFWLDIFSSFLISVFFFPSFFSVLLLALLVFGG